MKKEFRILSHQEFDEIIHKTPCRKSQNFVIHYRENQAGKTRIGIGVSKKNGNAVTRNLIKRQIRAIVAKCCDYTQAIDVIIIARVNYDPGNFRQIEPELMAHFAEIGEKH
ncbi:MAG: ribonuclease P protein component [Bacilli bacterium]|nr:ribonuclease P protein component [Bacilli bacterium]